MKIDIHEEIFKMNDVELSSIIESVKLRRNQLHFKNAHSLRIGQRVSFQGRRGITRSEERRVGKECRSRWSPYH